MKKIKFTTRADKVRYCAICDEQLKRHEVIVCEICFEKALQALDLEEEE